MRRLEGLPPGSAKVRWNGLRDDGSPAAAGVYFVELRALDQVRNAVLVR